MGSCSFRSKQLTEVVISPEAVKSQKKDSPLKNEGIVGNPTVSVNMNIDKLTYADSHIQSNGPKLEGLDSQDNVSQKTRGMSSAKKNLMESRKLAPDYSIIPNESRSNRIILPHDEASGLIGLTNLGNTCFLNSALQCLLNTPPLADYFMNDIHTKEINTNNFLGSKGVVTLSLAELYKQYWSREDINVINPREFYGSISKFAPQFSYGTQEDSQEFMAFLLDIVHEDLNRVKDKPYTEDKDYNDNRLEEHATESWKHYLMRNKSIIVDLFQGQSKSTLKCLQCGYVSHKFEPFMYLSLPIPEEDEKKPKVSLIECLKEYSKEEKLDGEEKWNCSRCKVLAPSTKKMEIWKLPNILIVHLKRFKFNREMRGKIKTFIDFPHIDFDLSSVAAGAQRDLPIYDLFAVSNHEGNLSGGHYYTFAKNRDNHNWYAYNDSEVLTLGSEQLVSSSAYLLFFSKTSVPDFRRQTLSRPEAWPHLANSIVKSQPSRNNIDPMSSKRTSMNKLFDFNQIRQSVSIQNLSAETYTRGQVDLLNVSSLANIKKTQDYHRDQTQNSPIKSFRDPSNDRSQNPLGQIESTDKQSIGQKLLQSKLTTEKSSLLKPDNGLNGMSQNLAVSQSVSRSRNTILGEDSNDKGVKSPNKSDNKGFLPSIRNQNQSNLDANVQVQHNSGFEVTPEIKFSKKNRQLWVNDDTKIESNLQFFQKVE